ncbi:hypothetical protein KFK09_013959 [Dendrobium nobile]|uniref:Uncharacterized protein n=1 Tax=Dendrobium nobile TaxID=94219 RepID=A0A8T3BAN2_DENNO|nr:hypothetical protein KFK09_013959 [Dendrobium nobile]
MYSHNLAATSSDETKQLITEGTIRVRKSLSYSINEDLEARVLSNELFRCVIHTWDEDEDELLWNVHDDMKTAKEFKGNPAHRELGWNYVQEGFPLFKHHLVAKDFLKGRILELSCDKDNTVAQGMGRSMMDIDNCILYSQWDQYHDKHILDSYQQLLQNSKNSKLKDFLNGEDWQQLQLQFQINF